MAWQFHLEADATRIEQWLIGHAVELAHASVSVQVLRDETAMYGRSLGNVLDSVMSRWLEGLPR